MPEETIEVVPSEDNGNVPAEAPSEQPKVEAPAPVETEKTEEPVKPTEPTEAELFDLPDGRKVDAATLAKEFKENFLPEFTRKSQELAKLTKGPETTNPTQDKPYQNPEWQPKDWNEAIQIAKSEALQEIEAKEKAHVERQQAVENAVVEQLTAIKTTDPNVNESALFQHAVKYGFKDLTLAHQNMKDMSEMVKKVQTTTATNIAKRNDPVSGLPGATGSRPDPSQFENARDYLRSLK